MSSLPKNILVVSVLSAFAAVAFAQDKPRLGQPITEADIRHGTSTYARPTGRGCLRAAARLLMARRSTTVSV